MTVSIEDFWKLLAASRLLTPRQVQELAAEFAKRKSQQIPTAKAAAEWLFARKVLTRYQAAVLLARRPGPFFFADYKVCERIEQGRLARCFRAVHVPTGHPVLLQFLTDPLTSDPQLWAAAVNAALAACQLISPHLQRFFEPLDLQKFKLVASEDLHGKTLDESFAGSAAERCAMPEACRIARLAAVGLAHMHLHGRAHGDIRPANLLLEPVANELANVKLLYRAHQRPQPVDLSQEQSAGSSDGGLARADYLAPELASAGRVPDPLSDIYALGCTFYALLTGKPPFADGDIQQKAARHAAEPIKPLAAFGVPEPLAQIVAAMLAKNPALRPQSAALVAEVLAPFVDTRMLYVPPATPPATLALYEQAVRQRLAQVAASLPVTAAVPAAPTVPPPPFVPSPAPSIVATPVAPPLQFDVPAKKSVNLTADEILRRRDRRRRTQRIFGICATLIVAVSTLAAANWWWPAIQAAMSGVASAGNGKEDVEGLPHFGGVAKGLSPAAARSENEDNSSGGSAVDSTRQSSTGSGVSSESKAGSPRDGGSGQQVVSDDGNTLWAPPTTGGPVSFHCVPPEAQIFFIARPADILTNPEGQRVLAALGPNFAAWRQVWEAASGVALDEVEQLIVTFHNNDSRFPRTCFVVKTKALLAIDQLLAKWGNPSAVEEKSQKYYTGAGWSYYVPASQEQERTFAMGDARDIKEIAAASGAPPVLFRDIERLRRTIDDQRHFTLLLYPQFLFNDDGEPLLAAERAKLRQPLDWLLGDHLQAAAASLHFGDQFYFEARMLPSLDKQPYQLAQEVRARLNDAPQQVESYIDRVHPPSYWSRIARRYPLMVGKFQQQMRIGVENEQAIINSVLPGAAAHNLVLGGELLVATAPGPVAAVESTAVAAGPQNIQDVLQLKTTYSFDQQSLEFAMRDLAEDVKGSMKDAPVDFVIKIIGTDLEKDGITRNQSIRDFKEENRSVGEILTALVRKANPITTVKDPSEPEQKLVWVIGPDPDNAGRQVILITTRTAAAAKKYTLPAPFVAAK